MNAKEKEALIKAFPAQTKSELTGIAGLTKGWTAIEKFLDTKAKPNSNAFANELNKID